MPATAAAPRVDRVFRAFADRTRLRILNLLRDGELCVGDLVEILRVPQAKTSRHLKYLRSAGLIRCREERLWSFYSLAPATTPFHRKLLECFRESLNRAPEIEADARRAKRLRKEGGCCPK